MEDKKIKIVTCASYGGTGSSVISDLLKEFNNCYSFGSYEFRFLQDPDGISDLEYGIIENNNRLSTGYFIKRFKKVIDYYSGNFINKRYKLYFGKKFKKLSYEYIDNIVKLKWKGTWLRNEIDENILKKYTRILINITLRFYFRKEEHFRFKFKEDMYCTYLQKEEFYSLTKEYTNSLFSLVNKENKYKYLLFDQLVPSSNINRFLNYFYNIKIIVVDRDPRDLYILNKEIWKEGWIPMDLNNFIKYIKIIHEHQKFEIQDEDKEKILRIQFEDMIYYYEKSLEKILKFLDLDPLNHINYKKFFNPDISKKNTKLWLKYPKYKEDAKKIKEELFEYCYKEY